MSFDACSPLPGLGRIAAGLPACGAGPLPVGVRLTIGELIAGGSMAGGLVVVTWLLRAGAVCVAELARCDAAEDFGVGAVSGAHAANTKRLFAQNETASLCMMHPSLPSLRHTV
jgi:hypothetical protein